MNRVRLRPHHIDIVCTCMNMGENARNDFLGLMERVFGETCGHRLLKFIDSLDDSSFVEVVSGNDDLCEGAQCPYLEACRSKDYRAVQDRMLQKLPADTSPGIVNTLRTSDPETEDARARQDLGVEAGHLYTLRKLRQNNRGSSPHGV